MTRVQDAPSRDASNAVRTLGLKVALDAVEACATALHQTGKETQIAAIAGTLENELSARPARVAWQSKTAAISPRGGDGGSHPVRGKGLAHRIQKPPACVESTSNRNGCLSSGLRGRILPSSRQSEF